MTTQLTEPSLLNDRALDLLDDLVALVVTYYFLNKQSYTFYKSTIEQWQDQGYYSDAMLYFWDDSPTEGLGDIEGQYFRHFLKVINELGILLPSRDDALKVQTLFYIDKLYHADAVNTQTTAILDFWLGIDDNKTYYADDFDKQFSSMDKNGLIKQLGYPEHINAAEFYQAYQIVLNIAQTWQHQYLNDKRVIYQTLRYTGQAIKRQVCDIQNQYLPDTVINDDINTVITNSGKLSVLKRLCFWLNH